MVDSGDRSKCLYPDHKGVPTMATPATTPAPKRTWSDLTRGEKTRAILVSVVIVSSFGVGFWFFLGWAFPPSVPLTPEEQAQRAQEQERGAAGKAVEGLKKALGKELRPNKDIDVEAWEHHEGGRWYVHAEYRPLLTERQAIDWEMMDAYKVIYESDVPVWKAVIVANATLIDPYGKQVHRPDLPHRNGRGNCAACQLGESPQGHQCNGCHLDRPQPAIDQGWQDWLNQQTTGAYLPALKTTPCLTQLLWFFLLFFGGCPIAVTTRSHLITCFGPAM